MSVAGGARMAARLATGAALAVAVVGATFAGIAFDGMPRHETAPVAVTAAPAAADRVLTCAGPILSIGRDATTAGGVGVAAPTQAVTTAGLAQDVLTGDAATGPLRLSGSARGGEAPQAAGAASGTVAASDLAGFAASACQPALMQSWLVGGSTTTGSTGLITLANPTAVAATVDLTLYGANGPSAPAAGADIVVAPGSERVVPLAALGLGEDAPIVQVASTGAPVRAGLQTDITRLLEPGGLDQQGMILAAATAQTITGIRVTAPGQATATTILRLAAPASATTATVTVVGAQGPVGTPRRVALAAGVPVEIPIDPTAAGTYTVTLAADAPLVGAVWQATGTGAGSDYAWADPAPALRAGSDTPVAVPQGSDPQLALWAPTATTVTVSDVDGSNARVVAVPAQRTVVVPVQAGAVLSLSTAGPVHAAVGFAGAGALATVPVWPADAASAPVVVHP